MKAAQIMFCFVFFFVILNTNAEVKDFRLEQRRCPLWHTGGDARLRRASSEVVIGGVTRQPGTVSSWNLYAAELEWFMHLSFLICWNKVSTFLFRGTSQVCRDGRGKDGVNVLEEESKVNHSVCPAVPFFSPAVFCREKKPGSTVRRPSLCGSFGKFLTVRSDVAVHTYIYCPQRRKWRP